MKNHTALSLCLAYTILTFPLAACGEDTTQNAANANTPNTQVNTDNDNKPYTAAPLKRITTSKSGKLFSLQSPNDTGVHFSSPIDLKHPDKRLYLSGFVSGGIAIGDIDGDRRPDLYLTSGPRRNKLYRQTSDLEFEDITASAGVDGGGGWSSGAATFASCITSGSPKLSTRIAFMTILPSSTLAGTRHA